MRTVSRRAFCTDGPYSIAATVVEAIKDHEILLMKYVSSKLRSAQEPAALAVGSGTSPAEGYVGK